MELVALLVVTVVAVAAIGAMLLLQERHASHVANLLARQDAERYAWAKERHSLNTRIQAPEVARAMPAVVPTPPEPVDPVAALQSMGVLQRTPDSFEPEFDPEDVDESHLVGTEIGA